MHCHELNIVFDRDSTGKNKGSAAASSSTDVEDVEPSASICADRVAAAAALIGRNVTFRKKWTEVHAKTPVAERPTLLDDGAAQVMRAKQEELVILANEIISRRKSIFDTIQSTHAKLSFL